MMRAWLLCWTWLNISAYSCIHYAFLFTILFAICLLIPIASYIRALQIALFSTCCSCLGWYIWTSYLSKLEQWDYFCWFLPSTMEFYWAIWKNHCSSSGMNHPINKIIKFSPLIIIVQRKQRVTSHVSQFLKYRQYTKFLWLAFCQGLW